MYRLIFLFSVTIIMVKSQGRTSYFEQCVAELKIPAEQTSFKPDDPNIQCLNACLMKKTNILRNGKIDADQQFNRLKKYSRQSLSTLRDHVSACADEANKESNECEIANAMDECLIQRFNN